MTGMISTAPTSAKAWLEAGAAAARKDRAGGTIFGQRLIARPEYPRKSMNRDARNGPCRAAPLSMCHNHNVVRTTRIGTGEKNSRSGRLNHLRAMALCAKGV